MDGDGDGRGLVLQTFRFLNGRRRTFVVTNIYTGLSGSCPYESSDDGRDVGFLTKRTTETGSFRSDVEGDCCCRVWSLLSMVTTKNFD